MDLINREELKAYIRAWNVGEGVGDGQREFLKAVDEQPTIDAVPVVKAEWIKTFRYMKENINTGKIEPVNSYDCPVCNYHTGNQGRNFNFCPVCGADMRKGGSNE